MVLNGVNNHSKKVSIPFKNCGALKKVIREKKAVNEGFINTHSSFYNVLMEDARIDLKNYLALPIRTDLKVTHIIFLANRRMITEGPKKFT